MTGERHLPVLATGAMPARAENDEVQLRDLWLIFRRNLFLIGGCLLLALGAAALYAIRSTPIYEGETSVRIDDNQSTLPVLDVLKEISTGNGSEISTEMEVLRSRTLAEAVVDSLSLELELVSPTRTARDSIFSFVKVPRTVTRGQYALVRGPGDSFGLENEETNLTVAAVHVGQPFRVGGATLLLAGGAARQQVIRFRLRPFAAVVQEMPKLLVVTRPSRDANVVVARYQSADRILARDVPNVLAYSFITRRQVVQKAQSHSTAKFLRQQLDTLTHQLAQAEDSLKDFRERDRVVSLTDQATAEVQQLAQLQAERGSLDEERSALTSLLAKVNAAAATARPGEPSPYRQLLAFPSLLKNQSVASLFQALTSVENERADLLIRRTPQDPDVMVLTDRVHQLEEQIRLLATTYLQGLTAQEASLDAQLTEFSKQLERVPAREVQYARLERRPKVLEDIYTMLQSRLKEAEIAEAVADPSVRIIDPAIVPDRPIKPNRALVVSVGVLLGLLLGIGLAFVRESMDRGIHTTEDVQRVTGAHVLALIPHIRTQASAGRLAPPGIFRRISGVLRTPNGLPSGSIQRIGSGNGAASFGPGLVTGIDPRSPVSEAYRTLRTSITFARADNVPRTLVFTSAMPGDGKSTTAANLAVTLAQTGMRVLLVDADMRRGVLNTVFGVPRGRGLSEAVLGAVDLSDCVQPVRIGEDVAFDLLTTGTLPPNPAELLGSSRMRQLLENLQAEYDTVLIDSPPVNVVTDAAVIGTVTDGVILVARAGKTSDADLSYATRQIDGVRAPLLGVVLNDVDFRRDARYGGRYGSYEYYYYAQEESPSIAR